MKQTDFFNIKRFGLLARRDLMLNRYMYLLIFLVLEMAVYLVLYLQMRNSPTSFYYYMGGSGSLSPTYQYVYMWTLIGLGLFIGSSFSGLGNKTKRMDFLRLPASTFEKFLYPFLFRMVLGWILFTLMYWVCARLAWWTVMHDPSRIIVTLQGYSNEIPPFEFYMLKGPRQNPWQVFMLIVVAIGLYLYTVPLFFRKQALIKTVISIAVIMFTVVCLLVLCSHIFFPEQVHGFNTHFNVYTIRDGVTNVDRFFNILLPPLGPVLLLMGYFKLKELKL